MEGIVLSSAIICSLIGLDSIFVESVNRSLIIVREFERSSDQLSATNLMNFTNRRAPHSCIFVLFVAETLKPPNETPDAAKLLQDTWIVGA